MRFSFRLFFTALLLLSNKNLVFSQNINYAPVRLLSPTPINTGSSTPVGTTEGSLSVSATGAANYVIPIKIAPGTAGMEPKLSLTYNSQGGSGIVGQGWGLSGMSAITRSGKDYYHDDVVKPIEWNNNDMFYLDGSRMTAINATTHGAANAIYATEQEVGTRIKQLGVYNNSPSFFEMQNKDGSIMHFGGSSSSLLNNTGTEVLVWKLSSIMDVNGNEIRYGYDEVNGEHLLTRIYYTINTAQSLSYSNIIKLNYKTREDKNKTYISGNVYETKNLLDEIEVWNSEQMTVRKYALEYYYDGVQSLLQRVQESGATGTQINETQFVYGDDTFRSSIDTTTYSGLKNPINPDDLAVGRSSITGDFNGDGFTDIVELKIMGQYTFMGLEFKMNNVTSNGFTSMYTFPINGTMGVPMYTNSSTNDPNFKIARNENFHTGDFDGDGVEDLIICKRGGFDNNTLESVVILTKIRNIMTGGAPVIHSYIPPSNCNYINDDWDDAEEIKAFLYVGDFDGDGISDFLTMLQQRGVNNNNISGWQITTPGKHAGMSSSFHFKPVLVNLSDFPTNVNSPHPLHVVGRSRFRSVLNFDGGSKHEFMFVKDDSARIFKFDLQYTGFWTATKLLSSNYPADWFNINLGDFNGDGLTDILSQTRNGAKIWQIGYSNGKTFVVDGITVLPQPDYGRPTDYYPSRWETPIFTADFDGDGKSDIGYIETVRTYVPPIYVSSENLHVKYNRGSSLFESRNYVIPTTVTNFLNYNQSKYRPENILMGDFNGDGHVDIFQHSNQEMIAITVGKNLQNNILKEVRNGLGAVDIISYLPLTTATDQDFYQYTGPTSFPLNTVKVPLWAVSKMESGIEGVPNPLSITTYGYKNLKSLKDGRGTVGFESNYSVNQTTNKKEVRTTSDYSAPFYLPQTVKLEEGYSLNGGFTILNTSVNHSNIIQIPTTNRYAVLPDLTTVTDMLTGNVTTTSTLYDSDDNPTKITTNIANRETNVKDILYAPAADTKTPMPSKPGFVTETKTRTGAAPVLVRTSFKYVNGLLKQQKDFAGLTYEATTTYNYNGYGLPVSKTMQALYINSPSASVRTETYEYDWKYRYVTSVKNPFNQGGTTLYDPRWGVPLFKTGYDGVTTTFEYDEFGSLKKTNLPSGYSTSKTLTWEPSVTGLNDTRYYETVTDPSSGTSKKGFNLYAQETYNATDIWNQNGNILTSSYQTTYDLQGRKSTVETPHLPAETFLTETITYDDLSRIASVGNANGTRTYEYTSLGNGNFKTEITDDYSRTKYSVVDPTGKTIESGDLTGITGFEYDSWGNVARTLIGSTVVSSATYDDYNRRIRMEELSSGTTTYEYNGFGELIQQTDANHKICYTIYNILGQVQTYATPELAIIYNYYDLPGQGEGNKLMYEQVVTPGLNYNIQKREYDYDNLGRLSQATYTQLPNLSLQTYYTYDGFSRPESTTYSSGLTVTNDYNTGALWRVSANKGSTNYGIIEEVQDVNGLGQPTHIWRGDGNNTYNEYEQGNLTHRNSPGIQDYHLEYDLTKGLIMRRRDDTKGVFEEFAYDDADRLIKSEVSGPGGQLLQEQVYGQSALSCGNIVSKSDVGLYSYENHTIKFNDNAAGAIAQDLQDITYASFHRPLSIKEGDFEATFTYGTDKERIVYELMEAGALKRQNLYLPDGVEMITDGWGNKTVVTYVPGASGIALLYVERFNPAGGPASPSTYYPYTDHLGSINVLVEQHFGGSASIAHEQAFGPWGRRRNAYSWETDDNAIPPADLSWLRGFTGHEHLDEFALVNMNARLYDPKLGRMLSVDNYVSQPGSAMGYNRYSYANNNPISYIDPDGNEPLTLLTGILIGAAISGAGYTAQAAFSPGGLEKNFNIGGFLGSVATGAVSGAISCGIGSVFGGVTAVGNLTASSVFNELGRATAHGLVGMGFSAVQGGDVWAGFASGFAGSLAGSAFQAAAVGLSKSQVLVGGGIFSMGVGAGTSYITGGDPWIGAALGGLSFYANHMLHPGGGDGDGDGKGANWDKLVQQADDMLFNLSMMDGPAPFGDAVGLGVMGGARLGRFIFGASKVAKAGASLGAARNAAKIWLKGVGNLSRSQLVDDIGRVGFKLVSPKNAPVQVFERNGLRIRLDPPQGKTLYNHMHIEYRGASYDINLNPVHYKSPAAHIQIN